MWRERAEFGDLCGVVAERFLESLAAHTEQTVTGVYAPGTRDVDGYLVPADQRPDATDEDPGADE